MKVKIADIKVGQRFRKELGDIESLAASMRQFGLIEPIVIDRDMNLISGERRLRAAQLLGWTEIEAVFRDETDELTRRELELEENLQRKEMTWQEQVALRAEIHRLKQQRHGTGKPGPHSGGWSLRDTAEALGTSVGTVAQDVELAEAIRVFPELAEEKSKTQALRKLKRLKERVIAEELARRALQEQREALQGVIHGDCLAVLREIAPESVDCVVTDPPWGVGLDANSFTANRNVVEYGDDPFATFEMLEAVFRELHRVLRPDTHLYVFYDIKRHESTVEMLRRAGFDVEPIPLIWVKDKPTTVPAGSAYASRYEAILWAQKGRRKLNGTPSNVLTFPAVPSQHRVHSAQKPVALLRELIEQSTVPGETVLDPFAGSGSTAVAAWQARRRFIVVERDATTFALMVERLKSEMGGGTHVNGSGE